ncbi:hypothetical protein QBZ16_001883 [Prototheca wickerhamii]|uniref:Uncharacterized protein n=1 Tax=Prototheca wickerhamii TaxID=3111 RepID=A0AAD9IJ43_PROWI|nr:hypothetical protein QBZ16_001883 [Prototheca wickerhamii]
MLAALEAVTPGTAAVKGSRVPPAGRASRLSFAVRGGILDMDAFDAAGHQRQPQERTPVLHRGPHDGAVTARVHAAKVAPPLPSLPGAHPPAAAPAPATSTKQELRDKVEHLEAWSREASTLLSSYQFAIAELEDRHSSTLKEELEKRLEAQAAAQQAQQAAFERQVDKLQRALLDQRAALHQANKSRFAPRQVEIQSVRLEAERKLQAQKDEHLQAMAQAEARAAALEAALSKQQEQTRQAAHQSALARAARDRACQDSVKKEEELVSLKVQVEALTGALAEYKAENSKAAEMKLRYKSIIAGLETELRDSQSERASLVSMCNELMARLEMQSRAKA